MSDENETKTGHDRWCPECGRWVPDEQQRVRADGLRRHSACDTVTTPTKTTPGEHVAVPTNGDGKLAQMCTCAIGEDHFVGTPRPDTQTRELAERMAADEAGEGNFAAAAELKSFAQGGPVNLRGEAGPELLFPLQPEQTYRGSNGLTYRGDPDAETGPLTPGQVMCTVCRLDDRTRAATDPNDLQCNVCRANKPIRLEKQHRRAVKLGPPRPDPATREARFRKAVEEFYGLGEWDSIHDDETAAGSAERDLRREEVDALLKLADMLDGHSLPEELVTAAGLGVREMEARAQPMRMVGVQLPCGPPKLIPELEGVAAAVKLILDNPPVLPEPPVRSRTVEEQGLATDLMDLLPQLRDVGGVLTYRANWLAKMLVDRGWVLAARGRVEQDKEADRG
jgi:hypothetical protein